MKKILTIVISVALVAAIAIGGTLAYLSSTANDTKLTNTFTTSTAGSKLDIKLDEGKVGYLDGKFTDTGETRVVENSYPIIPGATMDKDPTVTVLADSAPCYVFVYVTDNATVNSKDAATLGTIHSDWTPVAGYSGLYAYKSGTKVDTSSTDNKLPAVFSNITINSALTNADTKATPAGKINVQAYAYQASGDSTYTKAETAAIELFFPAPPIVPPVQTP